MDVRKKLVELLEPHMSGLACEYESGSCELTSCRSCNAKNIADHLIANGVTVQEWVSVKDRLPEEKVDCIVHYKHAYCDNDDYWAIGICFYDGEKFQIDLSYKVTHWQYLPQPPKGE